MANNTLPINAARDKSIKSLLMRPTVIQGELFASFPSLSHCQICNHPGETTSFKPVSDERIIYRSCPLCEKARLDMGFTPNEFFQRRLALLDDARRRAEAFAESERRRELDDDADNEWEEGRFSLWLRESLLTLVGPPECCVLGRLTVCLAALGLGAFLVLIWLRVVPQDSPLRTGLVVMGLIAGLVCMAIALQYTQSSRSTGTGKERTR